MPYKPPIHRDPRVEAARREEQRQRDHARGSASQRGYGPRWQRYAKAFLRRHPLCQCPDCQRLGRLLVATQVDHIIAVCGPDEPLFWEPSNHRAMAAGCHSRKTIREDGGFGRRLPLVYRKLVGSEGEGEVNPW